VPSVFIGVGLALFNEFAIPECLNGIDVPHVIAFLEIDKEKITQALDLLVVKDIRCGDDS